jgi:hypothetical protein
VVDSQLTKAVSLVQEARDTANLLHNTFVRIKLDKALEMLAIIEVEFNRQENEFVFKTKDKPTYTKGRR